MSIADTYNLFKHGKLEESLSSINKLLSGIKEESEDFFELCLLICEILVLKENFNQALDQLDILIRNPLEEKHEISNLKILLLKSSILNHLNKIKSSYILFQEVELRTENIKNKINVTNFQRLLIRVWRDKGSFFQFYGKHDEAENAFAKSLKLTEKLKDQIENGTTLNSYGLFKLNTDNLEEAESFFQRSQKIRIK